VRKKRSRNSCKRPRPNALRQTHLFKADTRVTSSNEERGPGQTDGRTLEPHLLHVLGDRDQGSWQGFGRLLLQPMP
jgi:hypothetical protein